MMRNTSANEPVTEAPSRAESTDTGPVSAAGGPLFALLGGVSALGYAGAVLLVRSDNSSADFLRFFSIFFLLACVWGLALWLAHRVEPARGVVLAGAVLFRLVLLPAGFSLETGQYERYLLYDDQVWRYLGQGWPAVLGFKVAMVGCDLAAVWLLMRLVGPGARGTIAFLAYAWNPLVVKEFAGSGHVDAVLVCLLLGAASATGARSGFLLGGAALVHPAALLMSPPAVRRSGPQALVGPLAAAAILLLGFHVEAGSEAFHVTLFRFLPGNGFARPAVGVAVLLFAVLWRLRRDDRSDSALRRYAIWVLGTALLVTPVFAPWRLTWLLPFAALDLSWFWLALSGSIFLSYHCYLSFREIPALTLLEFAMPLLVWIWIKRKRSNA